MWLNGIWGDSGENAFVVGTGGTILHFDGTNWIPAINVTRQNLWGIWGSSDGDVFAVGDHQLTLHFTPP